MSTDDRQPTANNSEQEVERLSEELKRQAAHAKQRISEKISLMEDRAFDPPKGRK